MGALLALFATGASRLDQFAPLFDGYPNHPQLLDQVKQIAFYSDCLGEAHWSEPEAVIDEPLARGPAEWEEYTYLIVVVASSAVEVPTPLRTQR